MINLFVVDDHHIFRDGLRMLIESVNDITMVGDAASGAEALEKLEKIRPDVVLMDVQMPNENGIVATTKLKALYPNIAVLILTMSEDETSLISAMKAGASGYVLKGVRQAEVLSAIRTAAAGSAVFSPSIAARMAEYFSQIKPAQNAGDVTLNQRERDILKRIAAGDDNLAIAESLSISPKTVRNNVSQL